jgi:hypothetical protein
MVRIVDRLYVGTEADCRQGDDKWAIIHACKSLCHQGFVGYRGNLPSNHPNYLVLELENDLILNMIDPQKPLFIPKLFIDFLRFSRTKWKEGKNILIHCNLGESRAPSLALLFLAKELQIIDNTSYEKAKQDFIKLYPSYTPGIGIQIYFSQHWSEY